MGVDTTFQPKTATFTVDSSAAVPIDGRQLGVTSWRIRALGAAGVATGVSGFIKWAQGSAGAPSAAATPVLGTPAANQLGVNAGQTLYIEGIGAFVQFIGNAALAVSAFEVTGGQGGCGG
jgi:hypothetical protein